jgi:multiple sugar transport system permease protein
MNRWAILNRSKSFNIEKHMPLFFILPCVFILVAVSVFPFVYSLWLSFNSWEMGMGLPRKFVGLANYGRLFTEDRFWNSMTNMGEVLIFGVSSQFIIGLTLAMLLNRAFRARSLITTLFLLPMMIAPVVVGCNWKMIYHYTYGPLNYILKALHLSNEGVNWLGSIKVAMPSVILSDTWEWTPFMMIVLLAGLQSIPEELYEAAKVDGASGWQLFWYITIPVLKPIIIIVLLIRTMDAFKLFDLVVLLTQGGPAGASETVSYYNYLAGFKYFDLGYAAAMAYVQLIVIIIIANVFLKFLPKRETRR